MTDQIPFKPLAGRVLVRQIPYKPSTLVEIVSFDKADENEGIVVALSAFRHGRRKTRMGWEITADIFPHELALGDRVIFPGKYSDEDTLTFNGVKHRCLDSWEITGIVEKPQPEGFTNPLTGEVTPDHHILFSR